MTCNARIVMYDPEVSYDALALSTAAEGGLAVIVLMHPLSCPYGTAWRILDVTIDNC